MYFHQLYLALLKSKLAILVIVNAKHFLLSDSDLQGRIVKTAFFLNFFLYIAFKQVIPKKHIILICNLNDVIHTRIDDSQVYRPST